MKNKLIVIFGLTLMLGTPLGADKGNEKDFIKHNSNEDLTLSVQTPLETVKECIDKKTNKSVPGPEKEMSKDIKACLVKTD